MPGAGRILFLGGGSGAKLTIQHMLYPQIVATVHARDACTTTSAREPLKNVFPAEAGIQKTSISLDSGFHRSDEFGVVQSFLRSERHSMKVCVVGAGGTGGLLAAVLRQAGSRCQSVGNRTTLDGDQAQWPGFDCAARARQALPHPPWLEGVFSVRRQFRRCREPAGS